MVESFAPGARAVEQLDTGTRVYVLCSDGCVLYATRFADGKLSNYDVWIELTVEEGRRFLAGVRATTAQR